MVEVLEVDGFVLDKFHESPVVEGESRNDIELSADSWFYSQSLILLEEIGLAPRGQAAVMAANGDFDLDGRLPLNTHGGLLSYGHAGVAGGMAHMVYAYRQ